MSPPLFNLVLDEALNEVQQIWRARKCGASAGEDLAGNRLTHVAFADDMTLIAESWDSLKSMLKDIRRALRVRGLNLHPSKSNVQINSGKVLSPGAVTIEDGLSVQILQAGDGLMILGTLLSLEDCTVTELHNRIASGWCMFWPCSACS